MPGPWEKYQSEDSGPWSKFKKGEPISTPLDSYIMGAGKMLGDAPEYIASAVETGKEYLSNGLPDSFSKVGDDLSRNKLLAEEAFQRASEENPTADALGKATTVGLLSSVPATRIIRSAPVANTASKAYQALKGLDKTKAAGNLVKGLIGYKGIKSTFE